MHPSVVTSLSIKYSVICCTLVKAWCLDHSGRIVSIRESVDSLCRDGADAQYMQYLSKSCITSPQTRKKAYLSIQACSLSAFVISKTDITGQKPRGRRLNAKVCDSKSAIFRILSSYDFCSNNDNS